MLLDRVLFTLLTDKVSFTFATRVPGVPLRVQTGRLVRTQAGASDGPPGTADHAGGTGLPTTPTATGRAHPGRRPPAFDFGIV